MKKPVYERLFGSVKEPAREVSRDLGKRLLDMSPEELDEVFDIAISRMVEMDRGDS